MGLHNRLFALAVGGVALLSLTACEGILNGIYDKPTLNGNQLYVDASDWGKWHYLDFDALLDSVANTPAGKNLSYTWQEQSIPTDSIKPTDTGSLDCGIYTYWYDVYASGLSTYEFRSAYGTNVQPDPAKWDIAVHLDNVRTNGGAAYETELTDMSALPSSSSEFKDKVFTEDSWNEKDVWVEKSEMLLGLIGSQAIKTNPVLSNWLNTKIPPMPPSVERNDHIFILRLKNGNYVALQLAYHKTKDDRNYGLTINFRYYYDEK